MDQTTGYTLLVRGTTSYAADRFSVANKAVFVSAGSYLSVLSTSASVYFSGEITVSMWTKIPSNTGCLRYFQCGNTFASTNFADIGGCDATYDLFWGIATGSTYLWGNATSIYNTCVHRASVVQLSGGIYTVTLYQNLASLGSATQNSQYLASNNLANCNFGYSAYGGQTGNVYYDDVVFWRRGLTFAELTAAKNTNF